MKRVHLLALLLSACASAKRAPSSLYDDCQPSAAGSLPDLQTPAGRANPRIPIEHVVVLMQENHSFDNYFGRLNKPEFYGREIDGVETNSQFSYDENGKVIHPTHSRNLCVADMDHSRPAMTGATGDGNHEFAAHMGARTMSFFDERDIPYYYALANEFAVGDRYFSSMLGPTYPNRFYLWAATSFGHDDNTDPADESEYRQETIFDLLNRYGVSWKYYTEYTADFGGGSGYLSLFGTLYGKSKHKVGSIADFTRDAAAGKLPSVAFVDADETREEDEHPDADIRVGQRWVAERLQALFDSPLWPTAALFLTYDEGGGFFDHVMPPGACPPDEKSPEKFHQLGFRVPFVAVSPYAKHHYVSHHVFDHTSILRFIETKWNLPALTNRDGRADPFTDVFDFSRGPRPAPHFTLPVIYNSECMIRDLSN
jgi:phospholipase C